MTTKRRENIPNQGALLESHDHDGIHMVQPGEVFGPFVEEPAPKVDNFPIVEGEPGSYVNIADRARDLKVALEYFSEINQRNAFVRAAFSNKDIQERYKDKTTKKQKEAKKHAEEFSEEAERRFRRATGYEALRASGLMSPDESDAQSEQMWDDFLTKYSKVGQSKQRGKLISQLDESISRTRQN